MGEGHNSTVRSRCHLGAPMPRNAFILPSSIVETRGWHEAGTRGAPENHPRVDGFSERQATNQRAALDLDLAIVKDRAYRRVHRFEREIRQNLPDLGSCGTCGTDDAKDIILDAPKGDVGCIEDSRGRLGDRIEELIYTNYTNDFVFLSHLVSPLVEIPRRQWRDAHR